MTLDGKAVQASGWAGLPLGLLGHGAGLAVDKLVVEPIYIS